MDSQREWKEFCFTEVFTDIKRGKRLKKADHDEGDIPYVSSTGLNNGVDGFIGNSKNVRIFDDCITLANSGSVGSAFFHRYKFVASDHVTKLKNSKINQYAYLFMLPIINRLSEKYSFNREINDERIKREKFLLPVTADGVPDWQYMEEYMHQKEQAILKPAVEKLCWRIINNNLLPPPNKIRDNRLFNVEWKEFQIGDLFNAKRPVGRKEDDYEEGDTAFVASGGVNNGVTKFCKTQTGEKLDKGNCLTVSPVDGSCYYQPVDFLGRGGAGSSIIILYAKGFELNRFNGLFISKAISQTASSKYSYGRMASLDRIKKDKILLPSDSNGNPDFAFMSSFMQEVEKDILGTTLKYFEDKTRQDKTRQDEWGLEDCQYKDFVLKDIFTILEPGKSKGLNHLSIADNGISYLGATNVNNGVLGFVAPVKSMIQKGNCIAFIRNGEGSMGYAVYKAEDFIATSDMTIGYNEHLNKYIGCYITTIADRIRGKYNFGYKRNAQRLAKEILTLPVTDDGTPDWDYMEAYMKQIECDKILQYLRHISGRVA